MSALLLPVLIAGLLAFAAAKRVNVYDAFLRGAKTGLETALGVLPALTAVMIAVAVLRASGLMEMLRALLAPFMRALGLPDELAAMFVLRPVSGSAALAELSRVLADFGPDSAEGRVASVMMGSTETIFYTLSVYFGAVGLRRTRHALPAALLSCAAGAAAAALAVRLFF